MSDSVESNDYNPEVCRLKHESALLQVTHFKEDSDQAIARIEKRQDKQDARYIALVLFLISAVGGIISPIVIDLIKKLMATPVVR